MSDTLNEQLLDEDELLAVKEVRLAYDNMKVVNCLDISSEGTAAWDAAYKRCVYRRGKGRGGAREGGSKGAGSLLELVVT